MNKIFVKTQNVKNFIGLVENLINKPQNIPKMGLVHRKLERYKHLYDRFSEILKFETFGVNDLSQIFSQLSEIPFTPESIEYIHKKYNRFRQIVQLINQMGIFAKDNNLAEITKEIMEQII